MKRLPKTFTAAGFVHEQIERRADTTPRLGI
jgi:hypothetical protein